MAEKSGKASDFFFTYTILSRVLDFLDKLRILRRCLDALFFNLVGYLLQSFAFSFFKSNVSLEMSK